MRSTLVLDNNKEAKEKVKVYELYPIEKLVQFKLPIQYTIFEPYGIKIDNEKTFFSISATSGWMNFSDHSQLWQSKNNNLLDPNAENVIKAAEDFIENNNQKINDFNLRQQSDLPSFFPQKHERKLNKCFAVRHRDGDWIDHWLCIFEIYVSGFRSKGSKALLYGTALELRIGVENRIIAFSSRWRPYTKTFDAELLPPDAIDNIVQQHDHTDDKNRSPKSKKDIIYVLDGDSNEQYHLAPYYYEASGRHLLFTPACKFSLSISIFQQDLKEQTQLIAVVIGGSGDYNYKWSYWNFNGIIKENKGVIELGTGQTQKIKIENKDVMINTIKLPIGFYNIVLNVIDNKTKAFKHTQQMIFSKSI